MKPTSDPGLHLTSGRRRWIVVAIAVALLLAIALALTDDAGAAPANTQPARVCTAWRSTCNAAKTVLGVKVCYVWRFTCTKFADAGKIAGLAAPRAGGLRDCICFDSNGHRWPCAIQFRRVGVRWLRTYVCIPPRAARVDGLAAPLPMAMAGNRGGCKASNYWTNISCTVTRAGKGWAFGSCELGYAFSGSTRGTFDAGDAVVVSGCLNDRGVLLDGGRKYPLRIRAG